MSKSPMLLLFLAAAGCGVAAGGGHVVVNESRDRAVGQPTSIELAAKCPDSLAAAGSACDGTLALCEYGDDPREDCRPALNCTGLVWTAQQPACPALVNASSCPANLADIQDGAACDPNATACAYAGVLCVCAQTCNIGASTASGGAQALAAVTCSSTSNVWQCDTPEPSSEGEGPCPMALPVMGSVCTHDTVCVYGNGCGAPIVACDDNTWQMSGNTVCDLSAHSIVGDS